MYFFSNLQIFFTKRISHIRFTSKNKKTRQWKVGKISKPIDPEVKNANNLQSQTKLESFQGSLVKNQGFKSEIWLFHSGVIYFPDTSRSDINRHHMCNQCFWLEFLKHHEWLVNAKVHLFNNNNKTSKLII